MRNKMQKLFLLLATLLCSGDALASDLTLLQVHQSCTSANEGEKAACNAFLFGYIAGLEVSVESIKQGKPICLLDNFSTDQLKLMLNKIVRDGPQFMGLQAIIGLMIPLQVAFPCRKSN